MSKARSIVRTISLWLIIIGLIYGLVYYGPIIYAETKAKSLFSQGKREKDFGKVFELNLKALGYKLNADERKEQKVHLILSASVFLLGIIGMSVQKSL